MNNNKLVATYVRTLVLVLALVNQGLAIYGKSPLPISDKALSDFITVGFSTVASLYAWWKNNSLTSSAQEADEFLARKRAAKVLAKKNDSVIQDPAPSISIEELTEKINEPLG